MHRWQDLFSDLEAQADALDVSERAVEVGERTRIEFGAIGMLDRLRAALGSFLVVEVLGPVSVRGALERVGADWLLLDEGGREAVVAASAVRAVHGLGRAASAPGSAGVVASRLSMRSALRGLARDRSAVRVHLTDGTALDATIDRVGTDFIELAAHASGEPRRRSEVREVVLVPLAAVTAVLRSTG